MTSHGQSLKKLSQARLPRLKREIIELQNDPLKGIDVIFHDDITSMCLILTPLQGPFFGLRLHLSVNIPEEYPRIAPKVTIQTAVQHPNVSGYDGFICADILQSHNEIRSSKGYNGGYTPGYLLKYIFLQLLSFFSDQWVEQTNGFLKNIKVDEYFILRAKQIVRYYSCSKCGYNKPTCAKPIKVILTESEIKDQDIYGNNLSLSSSSTNINDDDSIHLSDTTVNELTDDAWLHIIEFLKEQEIFYLSVAYPRIKTLVSHYNILRRRQLVCYYLRKPFNEAILGISVRVGSGPVEKRVLIIEEFDLFSYEAFNYYNLRDGIWGNTFTHFLPVALNQVHFDQWDPSIIFKTIPGMINSMVVDLMKACDDSSGRSTRNTVLKASEKALQGYCLLLHLLIMLSEKYPEIIKEAENKVVRFMNPEEKSECHKSRTPNLGEFMIYLFLCKNMIWSEICPYFLEELLTRNVVWFLNQNAGLAYIEPKTYHSKYRINTTFELSNTSLRLVLFQVSFLKIMQGIGEDMKRSYGYPSDEMSNSLLLLIKQIYNVKTWDVFFKMIDFSLPEQNWEPLVTKMLKDAINKSYNSGYHRVPYSVNELYILRMNESQVPPPDKQNNTEQGNSQNNRPSRGGFGGPNIR
ncbi:23313_t:CDS:2, partial [Gigaspora rosea]